MQGVMEPGVMAEIAGRTGVDMRHVMLINEHIAEINRAIDALDMHWGRVRLPEP